MNKWLTPEILDALEKLRIASRNNFRDFNLDGADPFLFNRATIIMRLLNHGLISNNDHFAYGLNSKITFGKFKDNLS